MEDSHSWRELQPVNKSTTKKQKKTVNKKLRMVEHHPFELSTILDYRKKDRKR